MNYILENVLVALLCTVFGYLIGGIPNGVVIGRVFFKKDPRDYGSHNSGGTNSGRVLGKNIGFLVIGLDILKAVIAFWTVWAILRFTSLRDNNALWDDGILYNWMTALGVAIGHCFSPYLNFKGGKAVACFMGITGGTSWLFFIIDWLAFLPMFLHKRIVSFSSLISGAIICAFQWLMYLLSAFVPFDSGILMWNFAHGDGAFLGWESATVATLVYVLMVIRHRQNIERLKKGEEKPLTWPSK